MEKICAIAAEGLEAYPQCIVNVPGATPDRTPLLPIFTPEDFQNTNIKLQTHFLRRQAYQELLRKKVPSLNNPLPISLGTVAVYPAKHNHSIIELGIPDEDNEELLAERKDVCRAIAQILGYKDFDINQLTLQSQAVKIFKAPKGSAPEEVLFDIGEEIDAELPAKGSSDKASLPNIRSSDQKKKRPTPPHRKPKPQTREDLERMMQDAELQPVRQPNPGSRRRRRR